MKSKFWQNKKILITGGAGFLGSHLTEKLLKEGARIRILTLPRTARHLFLKTMLKEVEIVEGDCRNLEEARRACRSQDVVMNLAAQVGGISYNRKHQGSLMRDNLLIGTIMIEAARLENVEHFLVTSSACVYPRTPVIPTPESEGFRDEPEPTNGGYGWAKRMNEKIGIYYAEEFGMKVSIARPYNLYGPRDDFKIISSHVIPALIRKVISGPNPIVVWGSGKQTRAFLYVDDAVRGILKIAKEYCVADPLNLGSDEEITIKDLIYKILSIAEIKKRVVFDTSKPDGSPRRKSDNSKAKKAISFEAKTKLNQGLEKTIKWYRDNEKHLSR